MALEFASFKVIHFNDANQNQSWLLKLEILLIHCSQSAFWESFSGFEKQMHALNDLPNITQQPGLVQKLAALNHVALCTKPPYHVYAISHHTLREDLSPLNEIQEIVEYPIVT